jgi:hypothetical protein
MSVAITLTLDDASASRVVALWDALAASGIAHGMDRLGYVPHVTILVWPEGDPVQATPHLPSAAAVAPAELVIGTIGVAPGAAGTLWLSVVTTDALLALHGRLAGAVAAPIHPHYQQGAWMPHVTLAINLAPESLPAAVTCIAEHFAPFVARPTAIEALSLWPATVLARESLG